MELLKKISDHEIKLIIVFFTLIICIGSYQLGYRENHLNADRLATENTSIRIQINELAQKQENKDAILKETMEMNGKTEALLDMFPCKLEQESMTMFISALAEYSGMKISQISYDDTTLFYTDAPVTEQTEVLVAQESADTGTLGTGGLKITGYKTGITISYQTTYEGLKKGIGFITQNEERMNLTDLTAAFDHTTGNLTGVMTLQMYAVDGTGKKEKDYVIAGVKIGTDNVFGSFEIASEEDEYGAEYDEVDE